MGGVEGDMPACSEERKHGSDRQTDLYPIKPMYNISNR